MGGVPAPLVLARARFWFKAQKCVNMGWPCLDKPVLPRGMYHGKHVADISQPYPSKHGNAKQQASIPRRTQEHVELQLCYATHIDPSRSLHKATNHILYSIRTAKTMVPKQTQQGGNMESPCLDKPVLGLGAGGGNLSQTSVAHGLYTAA